MRQAVLDGIGGVRGIVDSSLPVLVFAVTNLLAPVRVSVAAAAGAGVAVIAVRLVRRQTVQQAVSGMFGLGIACLFALRTGKASGFYLPGILYAAGLSGVASISVLARAPLAGYLFALFDPRYAGWRDSPVLLRVFEIVTASFACWYVVKAGISGALYLNDHSTGLAGVRLALGWPPLILLVLLAIGMARNALQRIEAAGCVARVN
jgi:hypothetical protein